VIKKQQLKLPNNWLRDIKEKKTKSQSTNAERFSWMKNNVLSFKRLKKKGFASGFVRLFVCLFLFVLSAWSLIKL